MTARADHSPHVARYFHRVDEHLPTLASDEARACFLDNERRKWIERYQDWMHRVDADLPTDPDVVASDFVITIADIESRARRYQPIGAAA